MKKVIVICGPTASGKTALSIECAKRFHGEIISADSMLVYRHCNVGSAKPTEEEKQGIPHYMIDVASPHEEFSVSDYEAQALPIVERLLSEGKTPIICGGTGFYIKSLLFKSHFGCTAKDENVRKKYEEIASTQGVDYLHDLLAQVDPESAKKLHPNDIMRVVRALEIFELTGKKKSEQADKEEARFDYLAVQYDYERSVLYDRINQRVDIMFRDGLIEEVRSLMQMGVTDENQCMQGIGYKEVYYGLLNGESEEQIRDKIKQNTRNYAKRQITFFKKLPNTVSLPPKSAAETVRAIEELL